MSVNEVLLTLIETAEDCQKDNEGWMLVSSFGVALRNRNFNYRKFGYDRLTDFLAVFKAIIKINHQLVNGKPTAFMRVIPRDENGNNLQYQEYRFANFGDPFATKTDVQLTINPESGQHSDKSAIPNENDTNSPDPENSNHPYSHNTEYPGHEKNHNWVRNGLFQWGYMGDYLETLTQLGSLALKEQWYYGKAKRKHDYPILSNYLLYTFYRLQQENKVMVNKFYAAFNTGLADTKYKAIYALFEVNARNPQPWSFVAFCVEGEGWAGKKLVSTFNPLPKRANYFQDGSQLIYDATAGHPSIDHHHILIDNAYRLPEAFIKQYCPAGFSLKDTAKLKLEEVRHYYSELSKALESDDTTYRKMKSAFESSIDLALKRVEWNYRMAIPMYYPYRNKTMLLLPLSLVNDNKIDVALVVERTYSGKYIGHTLLELAWAYTNARLIAPPESDWLIPKEIEVKVMNYGI